MRPAAKSLACPPPPIRLRRPSEPWPLQRSRRHDIHTADARRQLLAAGQSAVASSGRRMTCRRRRAFHAWPRRRHYFCAQLSCFRADFGAITTPADMTTFVTTGRKGAASVYIASAGLERSLRRTILRRVLVAAFHAHGRCAQAIRI